MTDEYAAPKVINIKDAFGQTCQVDEDALLGYAQGCITTRFEAGECLNSSALTRNFIRLLLAPNEREVFYVIWLNNQNEVLKHGPLFFGTVDGATVHPREVVKQALACNAAAVIFAHNHPSGHTEPSQADIGITRRLKSALSMVDIRTLDHMIVGEQVVSMAELGLM